MHKKLCVYAHVCVPMCVYVFGSSCICAHVCVEVSLRFFFFFFGPAFFEIGFFPGVGLSKEAELDGQGAAEISASQHGEI